ncbi:MAG: DEAD/DEAH box helicase, partial [Halieaceae bacterium]|nr:DEAD/DEAH box helicase [Halieaceae bacterium]
MIHSRLSNHVLTFDPDLPINLNREEIAKTLKENQVVIVTGDTGSGKTTQLPKICLDLGYAIEGQIGLTQPRRLAARTVAARIASEIGTSVGSHVGFKIRFEDQLSDDTLIKIMTDGILLSEFQQDPDLLQYSTLIIDEAHERSLNIDFILGYLKNLLPRRRDLKVLITSATFDVQSFANYFNNAPIITIKGRTYPINTIYREESSGGEDIFFDIESALSDIIRGDFGEPGDILIFLPTEWHIRQLLKVLRVRENLQILPLYARLTHVEQNRVFNAVPGGPIRVVL